MAEFLAGASGWYDHEPLRPLNQQTASQCGKRRDGNGAAIWLPNLASTGTSQGGKPTIRKARSMIESPPTTRVVQILHHENLPTTPDF